MRLSYKVLIFLCSFLVESFVKPELLIVKRENNLFKALSEQERLKYGEGIAQIFLKYQWPTCISSQLTNQEQDELLTSGVAQGEEKFIQKKIKEFVGKDKIDIQLVFVPQSLFDYYCLIQYYKNKKDEKNNQNEDDQNVVKKFLYFIKKKINKSDPFLKACAEVESGYYFSYHSHGYIDLTPILNSSEKLGSFGKEALQVRKQMHDVFGKENEIFFDGQDNAFIYMNQKFVQMLFDEYKNFANADTSFNLSNMIKAKSKDLTSFLSKQFEDIVLGQGWKAEGPSWFSKIIEVEYEAWQSNKALLMRGTGYEKFNVSPGVNQRLAGNTLHKENDSSLLRDYARLKDNTRLNDNDVASNRYNYSYNYNDSPINLYSISFGSSLFGGMINDKGACAAWYLSKDGAGLSGYALLIDKKDYLQTQTSRLFLIPPLSYMATLFCYGEWFHARATVATLVPKSQGKLQHIHGLATVGLYDPTGVLLITRDPLLQAELFSKFLAQDGRLLQFGDNCYLTQIERVFVEKEIIRNPWLAKSVKGISLQHMERGMTGLDYFLANKSYGLVSIVEKDLIEAEKLVESKVKKAQVDVANYYKAIRILKPKIDQAAKKHRAKKAQALQAA